MTESGGGTVFKVNLIDDVQAQNARREQQGISSRGFQSVRRPTRGVVLREETFATLRVVAGDGNNLHVIDAGSTVTKPGSTDPFTIQVNGKTMRATDIYSNFLLQNVIEDRQEKAQILETFGEPYIFLFGERARVIAFQGILLNSWDFNWEAEWWANYDNFLRGTKCVENDARVYLAFDNTIVGGYIVSSNVQKVAQERHWLQFQFQLFVTYYETFSHLGQGEVVQDDAQYDGDPLTAEKRRVLFDADRPPLIDTKSYTAYEIGDDGKVQGYFDTTENAMMAVKMANQPRQLAEAWRKIQRDTNLVLSTASQVWSGTVVRVPEGFAGVFAYDEKNPAVQVREQNQLDAEVVRYTTFDKNKDEYVGESSHYGSSLFLNRNVLPDVLDPYRQGQSVVEEAKRAWRKAGIDPDPGITATMAKAIKAGRLALMAVNATRGVVAAASGMNESVQDFSGGMFNWSDVYENLRRRSDDNPYPE
jgi:hypothetical protein